MGTKPTLTSAQAVAGTNNVIDISYPADPVMRGIVVIQLMQDAAKRTGRNALYEKLASPGMYSDKVTAIGAELEDLEVLHGPWRSLIFAALRVLPIEGEFNDDGPYWASFVEHIRAVAP